MSASSPSFFSLCFSVLPRALNVLELGMNDEQEISFPGEGEPHIDGDPGDLRLRIKTLPHARFERRGDDLFTNVTISLREALLGFEMDIPHLDGHSVHVSHKNIVPPGHIMAFPGEGMKNFSNHHQFGTLYVGSLGGCFLLFLVCCHVVTCCNSTRVIHGCPLQITFTVQFPEGSLTPVVAQRKSQAYL